MMTGGQILWAAPADKGGKGMKEKLRIVLWLMALGLLWGTAAQAQTALPAANAGFDITGFIQAATLNAAPRGTNTPAQRGGKITINGRVIVVPDNLIVQMPAASFKWAELFDPAVSTPVGTYVPARPVQPANRTGLALNDPLANHFPSYEVRVVGNIITDPATGVQRYIAGLIVPAAQQGLNGQSGYINFIDYATGRFRVGGTMGDSTTGTLCELNDPVGRFGLAHSPDPRFTCDTNNPTVSAATGYPVGIPTVAPSAIPLPPGEIGDPDRPYTNRPPSGGAFGTDPFLAAGAPLKRFTMPAVANVVAGSPDPRLQVPLMVGDWVDFSGTLYKIDPALGPGRANTFISVHTLTAHLGIKTQPGDQPAYIRVEEFLFGVGDRNGGPTVAGITQETSTRVAMVAFTTDSNAGGANLPGGAIFGIYVDPTGAEILQPFPNGSTAQSPADFNIDDPVRGRLRWTTSNNGSTAGVLANAIGPGKFYREYIVRLTGAGRGVLQLPNQSNGLPGLITGQYRLPIFDYIFGEGTNFGEPWPPFNFNDFGFLNVGEGPNVGRLQPFPAFQ
jgi:hypothetical protein